MQKQIKDIVESQKQPTRTVLSSLLAIQSAIGYIPEEALNITASFCSVTVNDVWSVACFYTNFRFSPPGKHVLEICWGPTCHLMGAQTVLDAAHKVLNIESEGETADGAVTLAYNTCLGACSHAPVVSVDHCLQGNITSERIAKITNDILQQISSKDKSD